MTDFGSLWVRLGALALEYAVPPPELLRARHAKLRHVRGDREIGRRRVDVYAAALPFAARRALAPVTPEGRDALRRALVDERGALRVGRLVAMTMARTPAENRTRRDAANRRERANDEKAKGEGEGKGEVRNLRRAAASAAVSAVSALLLEERDGRALRRVLRDADSIAAAKALLTRKGLAALRVAAERPRQRPRQQKIRIVVRDTYRRRPGRPRRRRWRPRWRDDARRRGEGGCLPPSGGRTRAVANGGGSRGGGAGGVGVCVGVGAREGVVGGVGEASARAE